MPFGREGDVRESTVSLSLLRSLKATLQYLVRHLNMLKVRIPEWAESLRSLSVAVV